MPYLKSTSCFLLYCHNSAIVQHVCQEQHKLARFVGWRCFRFSSACLCAVVVFSDNCIFYCSRFCSKLHVSLLSTQSDQQLSNKYNFRYRIFFSPIRHVPGPFLAKFTRLWHIYTILAGKQNLKLVELHKKHGHFVRISHDEVSVSHPNAIKALYLSPIPKVNLPSPLIDLGKD